MRAKQVRKLAKRIRRLAQLAARDWDGQDQYLADASAWEGFINKEEP
jgi:hypothetical protein